MENSAPVKKSVSFDKIAKVVLIPTAEEYREKKVDHLMWSSEEEMLGYRQAALKEIKSFQRNHHLESLPSREVKKHYIKSILSDETNPEEENTNHVTPSLSSSGDSYDSIPKLTF